MIEADGNLEAAEGLSVARAAESEVDVRFGDRQALEGFVVENADLEALEGLSEQFNIFEAVGVLRQELRHSDFLAFLLDPRQNHRLGDAFVQRLLQKIPWWRRQILHRLSAPSFWTPGISTASRSGASGKTSTSFLSISPTGSWLWSRTRSTRPSTRTS